MILYSKDGSCKLVSEDDRNETTLVEGAISYMMVEQVIEFCIWGLKTKNYFAIESYFFQVEKSKYLRLVSYFGVLVLIHFE